MTDGKAGLRGLKKHAGETLFHDWHVSPELKAELRRSIRRAERAKPSPGRRWLTWPATAVASVALLLFIGFRAGSLPAPAPGAPGPAVKGPEAGSHGPADSYGNTMTFNAQLMDQDGSATKLKVSTGSVAVVPAPTAIRGSSTSYSVTVADAAAPGAAVAGVEVEPGRKIVLNADYQLKVKDAEAAAEELQRLAAASGGYVTEAAVSRGNDGSYSGRLVLRVPAVQYGQAVLQISRLGEVTQSKQWSQDVTAQYTDLEVRIRLQQELEQKLEELALKAATFDDWLKLSNQINATRAQIESMQGSLKQLGNQVDYSTIVIGLNQPAPGQPGVNPAPPLGIWGRLGATFLGSLRALGRWGETALVGLVAAAPWLATLAAVAGIAAIAWRRRRSASNGTSSRRDVP